MFTYPDPTLTRLLAHLLRRRPYCKCVSPWRAPRRARFVLILEDYDE